MTTTAAALTRMSDSELVSAAARLATAGRDATADLIALLVVLEERKQVFADEGYSSLFRFCVGRLRLSEEEAYYRIAAARVAARFPDVLECLRAGALTLTAVAVLRKHLTEENHERLLRAAEGRTKREVQQLIATLAPRPDVRSSIRRLPVPRAAAPIVPTADDRPRAAAPNEGAASPAPVAGTRTTASAPHLPLSDGTACESPATAALPGPEGSQRPACSAPALPALPRRAEIRPLAPARYSLHVTISEETYGKLQQAKDLLQPTLPDGDPAVIIDRALALLVAHLQRVKFAAKTPQPPAAQRPAPPVRPPVSRASALPLIEAALPPPASSAARATSARPAAARRSRYIPAAVRRAVWQRDKGACAFVTPGGRRCAETGGLEFHHAVPFAE
ncbi:MAG: hypothetical protein EHM24_21575, partial [Acidobacteria bacterium]